MPIYNAETTIVEAVKSVLLQSYTDWELILLDDGSTDGSASIIQNYIGHLTDVIRNKIHYYYQENTGPSIARNKAIKKASGRYIAFLDSDDEWSSDKLELQLPYFNKKKIALIGGGFNKSIFETRSDKYLEISLKKLLLRNYFMTCSVVIDLCVVTKDEILFPEDQKYAEDYRVWLRINAKYPCIYINKVICKSITNKYNYGASGLSSQLWMMEKGELSNYKYLKDQKIISFSSYLLCSQLSLLKYLRRVFKVKLRK